MENFIDNKNITTSIYRIQANDSVMCRYIAIDFILTGKILLDHTNLFSSNECENNDEIILKNF